LPAVIPSTGIFQAVPSQSQPKASDNAIALALAAARENSHRRAVAVAAASAATSAAASIAAVAAKHETTVPIHALSNPTQLDGSNSSNNAPESGMLFASESSLRIPDASSSTEAEPEMRSGSPVHSEYDAADVALKNINVSNGCAVADNSSSAAAADGIILWSRIDKDKKVHLNDFLANRYSAPWLAVCSK
jgi:hypothetical protein